MVDNSHQIQKDQNANCDVFFLFNNPFSENSSNCLNMNMILRSGSYNLHQPIITHVSSHAHEYTQMHRHGSVSRSFDFPPWRFRQSFGFRQRCYLWVENSNADALETALTAVKWRTKNRAEKFFQRRGRKYVLKKNKRILTLSSTCFYSPWIVDMKSFSSIQWSGVKLKNVLHRSCCSHLHVDAPHPPIQKKAVTTRVPPCIWLW